MQKQGLSKAYFAIRFAGNPDALGNVYVAVPIGTSQMYELNICISSGKFENANPVGWEATNVDFEKVDNLKWHKQDIDLYAK